jgi:hypothetical protein
MISSVTNGPSADVLIVIIMIILMYTCLNNLWNNILKVRSIRKPNNLIVVFGKKEKTGLKRISKPYLNKYVDIEFSGQYAFLE